MVLLWPSNYANFQHANLNRVCQDQSVAFEEGMKLEYGTNF
jgi:hypothetical protein